MLPALIAGAAGLLGGMFQNSANKEAAQEQMKFQDEQSRTQYQRAVVDMRKAGLNPMLAYSQGGNASASGASYNAVNVGDAAVRAVESGTNSAVKQGMMKAQIDNMAADTELKKAQDKAANASVVASLSQAQLANENSATVAALRPFQVGQANYQEGILGNQYITSGAESQYLNSPVGKLVRQLALGGRDASEITSAVKSALPRFLR